MKITNASKSKSRKITTIKTKRAATPVAKKIASKARPAVKASAPQTKRPGNPLPAQAITSEQIARHAYSIWEQQGRPAGKEAEHWLLAEQELKSSRSFTE
jgi:hypothetical protein